MLIGELELICNTPDGVKARNAEINARRGLPRFGTQPQRDGVAVIVGGGPSLASGIEDIRWRKERGQEIWATNNAFGYLLERGIVADAHVVLDSRPGNIGFLRPTMGVRYYLHISCDPSLYELLGGHEVTTYDLGGEGTGTTVGLKALYLAGFSGLRCFHLVGMDSSYADGGHHAYPQAMNDAENRTHVIVRGRSFECAPWMALQAEEFQQIAASFAEQDCTITVAGDGLLPWVARCMGELPPVTVLCSDKRHPAWHRLVRFCAPRGWALTDDVEELSGGGALFLVSCTERVGPEIRGRYGKTLVIHESDLPRGRGWSPLAWQVLEGRNDITFSMFEATDEIDAGPIVDKRGLHLEGHELAGEIQAVATRLKLQMMEDYARNT